MADYNAQNPFEEDEDKRGSVKKPTPSLPPKSTLREPDAFSGRYAATTNSPIDPTWEGVKRKEAELKRREDDLAKRETNLQEREQSVPKGRVNNFPPCKPLVHQNIAEDMPTDATKSMVRRALIGWYGTLIAYFWNMIMLLSALIARGGTSYITGFILSIVYIIFAYPISFFIFRLLYQAARKGKPSLYVMYFIFIWFEMATWAFYAVGIYQYGGGGFFCHARFLQKQQSCWSFWCYLLRCVGSVDNFPLLYLCACTHSIWKSRWISTGKERSIISSCSTNGRTS